MRSPIGSKVFTGLLLMTIALFAPGCASDGGYSNGGYPNTQVDVYGYGYYGGYPGYYGGDVIVGAPVHPGVRPPGAISPAPPHVSQLPSRPMPAPAPRTMPAARGGGGGRR